MGRASGEKKIPGGKAVPGGATKPTGGARRLRRWVLVLSPGGVVEAAEGGAPQGFVGHPLSTHPEVPAALRVAAEELLARPSASHVQRLTLRLPETNIDVELLLVEGLPLRRAYTEIADLLLRTLDVFVTQAISTGVDLTVSRDEDVPAVLFVDGEKIAWALATLVTNALRYAEKGPRGADGAHVRVRLGWDAPAESLRVTVTDNGPGMTAAAARWLFDRDPATGRAAGLALLLVRDVALAHRGSLEVTTRRGTKHGTTFTMIVPKRPAS